MDRREREREEEDILSIVDDLTHQERSREAGNHIQHSPPLHEPEPVGDGVKESDEKKRETSETATE